MNTRPETVNRLVRSLERSMTIVGFAAVIFAAMALLWWRGRESVALIACVVVLTVPSFTLYRTARSAIAALESEKSGGIE